MKAVENKFTIGSEHAGIHGKFIAGAGDDCWEWTACKNTKGYGRIKWGKTSRPAYHVVWEFFNHKPVPKNLEADHLCRNRGCVNPNHIEFVTHQVNCQRKAKATHCPSGHEFTKENTYLTKRKNRGEYRRCLKCKREKGREYQRRKRNTEGDGLDE